MLCFLRGLGLGPFKFFLFQILSTILIIVFISLKQLFLLFYFLVGQGVFVDEIWEFLQFLLFDLHVVPLHLAELLDDRVVQEHGLLKFLFSLQLFFSYDFLLNREELHFFFLLGFPDKHRGRVQEFVGTHL